VKPIANCLRDLWSTLAPHRLPEIGSEMTAHDAMRLCAGREFDSPVSHRVATKPRSLEICWYRSEDDLREIWQGLNLRCRPSSPHLVVLVLGKFLRANLRDLIRRIAPNGRLVIVPHPGHWPGVDSFGDLALASASLGWNSIELCRDPRVASEASASLIVLPVNSPTL
jgi:hypothetical protein